MKTFKLSMLSFVLSGFIFSSCKKECPPVITVTVDAGVDQTVVLPATTGTLVGTVTSGAADGTTYTWSLISGPTLPSFSNNHLGTTNIGNLALGTYVFQFSATNVNGTDVDEIAVVVSPKIIYTLTAQPTNNSDEAFVTGYTPNSREFGLPQFSIAAWTALGTPYGWRTFLKFDLASIPSGATIKTAKLSLYAVPTPFQGNGTDAHFGSANACYIQRVTSGWVTSTVSWNTQPTTTTTNQAVIPQSTSSFQDNIDLDVTNLVKDIMTNTNYGFSIRLQAETIYNIRQYCSSFYTTAAKHPKLVITYE